MCWDNDDPPEFWRESRPRAVKPHRCVGGCQIRAGEQYRYVSYKYDGYFLTLKQCLPCVEFSEEFGAACRLYDRYSTDPPPDDLSTAIDEHLRWAQDMPGVPPAKVWRLRRMAIEYGRRRMAAARPT